MIDLGVFENFDILMKNFRTELGEGYSVFISSIVSMFGKKDDVAYTRFVEKLATDDDTTFEIMLEMNINQILMKIFGHLHIFITDVEPDDVMSIMCFVHLVKKICGSYHDLASAVFKNVIILTTLRNPHTTADYMLTILKKMGVTEIRVLPGTKGIKPEWTDPSGKFVMDWKFIGEFPSRDENITTIAEAIDESVSTVIYVLSPATDFIAITDKVTQHNSISAIYMQGGNITDSTAPAGKEYTAGFNFVSDEPNTIAMLEYIKNHQIFSVCLSGAEYTKTFPGGSIGIDRNPDVLNTLMGSEYDYVQTVMAHVAGWGHHMVKEAETNERIAAVVSRVGGPEKMCKQFCPADIATVLLSFMVGFKTEKVTFKVGNGKAKPEIDNTSSLHLVKDLSPDMTLSTLISLSC